jgi:hypothetical protein
MSMAARRQHTGRHRGTEPESEPSKPPRAATPPQGPKMYFPRQSPFAIRTKKAPLAGLFAGPGGDRGSPKTAWLWTQSRANPSPRKFPGSREFCREFFGSPDRRITG